MIIKIMHYSKSISSYSMNNLKIWLLILLCLWGSLSSCESFLEVDLPSDQLTSEAVFEDYSTAEAAMVDIYGKLRDNVLLSGGSSGLGVTLGLYTDDLILYNSSLQTLQLFYTNSLVASNSTVASLWNNSYNLLYRTNSIIEGVESSKELSVREKGQLKGEAYFVRGLIHFYLVNLFGQIPFVDSTDYETNQNISKQPVATLYTFIIDDLLQARNLLDETYITSNRVRPNSYVVSALLARVYLFNEDYQLAEIEATKLINTSGLFQLEENLAEVFLINSLETIWQFSAGGPGGNTIDAQGYIFTVAPPPNYALTPDLINSFEDGDKRLESCTGNVGNDSGQYYFSFKYKENANTAISREYSVIFRLAEQYFIRAHSRLVLGDTEGAINDINKIRQRAGLLPLENNISLQLEHVIIQEQRLELFTELGHRFFDLKRSGMAHDILVSKKPGWNATDVLFPIPETELINNPNLNPQNPGYN